MKKNLIFGLAMATQLVESADVGNVPQEDARGWYKHFGAFEWISQDNLSGGDEWDEDTDDDAPPIDATSIGQMLCRMVRMGWTDEVRDFLTLGPCPSPGPAPRRVLPTPQPTLFRFGRPSSATAHQTPRAGARFMTCSGTCYWSRYASPCYFMSSPSHASTNLLETYYAVPAHLAPSSTISCGMDDLRTRQIFPISKPSAWPEEQTTTRAHAPPRLTFAIPRRHVSHVVRELSKGDFGCSYHTKMTHAAGPVFVVQKDPESESQQWLRWKKRKEEAVLKLRDLIPICLAGTVSDHELTKRLSLAFLNRRELEWTIPLQTKEDTVGVKPDRYEAICIPLEKMITKTPALKSGQGCRVIWLGRHGIKISWKPT